MRILYVSQYYPPDIGAPSARVSELAREWSTAGHDVTVLTAFSHHPHGKRLPEDRWRWWRWEQDGSVRVLRVSLYAAANAGFFWRIVSFLSFMLSAMLYGTLMAPKTDVVIATSPQLFTGVAGWWLALMRRARFIFEVRDLWPESIVSVGAMRPSRVIRGLERLTQWLYDTADRIVVVSEGYRGHITEKYGIDSSKIDVISNGVDPRKFQLDPKDRARTREQLGCQDELLVLYLGTHGMAHGLDVVLEAAERLQRPQACATNDRPVRFLLIGDGAERSRLVDMAQQQRLSNVMILGPQDRDRVVSFYAAADICLVPLRRLQLFEQVLPSKLFEIMAMQRPLILSIQGRAKALVEKAAAGVTIPPEDPEALATAITSLAACSAAREEMGRRGRELVLAHYDRRKLATAYLRLLQRECAAPAETSLRLRRRHRAAA